ncbi:MAG TPA: HAMP domain-containing protein [Firmicutes bacterium]|nr:HAMP domain-containing protein [Bacillota bacterium]
MRRRFFRAATLAILAGLVVAFLFAVPLMGQLYTDETEKRLDTALALVCGYSLPEGEQPYERLAEDAAARLAGEELRITLIAEDGTVLGDSETDPAGMANHAGRPEVRQALETGEGRDIRRSDTTGEREMYRAVTQTMPDGSRVVFRASLSLEGEGRMQATLWGCGLIGMFMGLVAALFAAHYSAGRLMEPLQELTGAARRIAAGETGVRVAAAPDEMGELSGAFNRMTERLAAAHAELEYSSERMAGILQGMDDGVIALDADGRITLLTRRARELLGAVPSEASRLEECGGNYLAVQGLLERAMESGEPVRETLALAGPPERILQVYAARVKETREGGALAVFSDVTRIRKLEIMRSEFVANVTHELKTPLTSIRGYIELLKSGPRDEETARSFYEIIEIEAERLQKLTDDLLQLSEIESGARGGENESVGVEEALGQICESLRPEAEGRGIAFRLQVEPGLRVGASPRRFHQLMKNLMENAVKYNRDNGSVAVTAQKERGVAVIRVADTGIGIPAEHLGRIFERFYRVDKGRSREQGGTGLGLSIVKHIVSLYGGDIQVESEAGTGSAFTVRLPL